ncbi:MAG: hypothetical protein Q4C12_05910 [Clostridia bacterium]|nr:hypothetical protein [Clostridia bacterium]
MKRKIISIITIVLALSVLSANAASVPRESAPVCATEEQIIVTENLVGHILDEVQGGLGYAEARAKSNAVIFNAWLGGQTSGFAYGDLVNIANNAIWQYRDMYLRPQFYIENEEKVRAIIADVITQCANGEIDYIKACETARTKIYQSVNPNFNPDVEYAKDSCYRDIPEVDSSLFAIARKLLINSK